MLFWPVLIFVFVALHFVKTETSPHAQSDDVAETHGLLNAREFSNMFRNVVHGVSPDIECEFTGELKLRCVTRDGAELYVALGNQYRNYIRAPESVDQIIEDYANAIRATLLVDVENNVPGDKYLPAIKRHTYIQNDPLQWVRADVPYSPPMFFPINDELIAVFANVGETITVILSEEDFSEIEYDAELAFSRAKSRLNQTVQTIAIEPDGPFFWFYCEETNAANLLLVDYVWNDSRLGDLDQLRVAVPARDTLVACSVDSKEDEHRFRDLVQNLFATNPYPISTELFTKKNNEWQIVD